MKHYIDITLLPSDDIGLHFLWQKVFQQVHLALVEIQNDSRKINIGLSFPEYTCPKDTKPGYIGRKLRIFSHTTADLNCLDINKWLNRLNDYVHIKEPMAVPENIKGFVRYYRYQPKSSNDRMARRRMKRHGGTYEEALQYYASMVPEKVSEPFIQINSLSSNKQFNLYIKQELVTDAISEGFSLYGLSPKSSLPMF